jgi:PTS system nitrogen regulatory IIA component
LSRDPDRHSPPPGAAGFVAEALRAGFESEDWAALLEGLDRHGKSGLLARIGGAPNPEESTRGGLTLADHLPPGLVLPRVQARTWSDLVDVACRCVTSSDPRLAMAGARLRERLATVNPGWLIGSGVAVPHDAVVGLTEPLVAVATLDEALDLGAHDGVGVELVFFLLEPPGQPAVHLALLSRIAGLCAPASNLGLLLASEQGDALHNAVIVLDDAPPSRR